MNASPNRSWISGGQNRDCRQTRTDAHIRWRISKGLQVWKCTPHIDKYMYYPRTVPFKCLSFRCGDFQYFQTHHRQTAHGSLHLCGWLFDEARNKRVSLWASFWDIFSMLLTVGSTVWNFEMIPFRGCLCSWEGTHSLHFRHSFSKLTLILLLAIWVVQKTPWLSCLSSDEASVRLSELTQMDSM